MARKEVDIEALNSTLPELPEDFENWCKSTLPSIPIYYRREKGGAECRCGKCNEEFFTKETPVRNKAGKCLVCGHIGRYEWKKVFRATYYDENVYLYQKTSENDVVCRVFNVDLDFQQYRKANIGIREWTRIFLKLGDAIKVNRVGTYQYQNERYEYRWTQSGPAPALTDGRIYPGYMDILGESNLRYCELEKIREMMNYNPRFRSCGLETINILRAYSNNPAIEMYAKAGMERLVRDLIYNDGKRGYINRRGKSMKAQLRLKDKQLINRLTMKKGDPEFLKVLQIEEKNGIRYTQEQEEFLMKINKLYDGQRKYKKCMKYMTLQQLMNRLAKYEKEERYQTLSQTLGRYVDYLEMREELGYDMTNEVYIHPKNLKKKHDEMVKERNARRDEVHIRNKLKEYPDIAKRYEKLNAKYYYENGEWIIRPARDAAEIIMEGRNMHHCVGGDNYLRKHNEGKTTILFLRKVNSPDKCYCTIEIKDKEILQWYEAHDKKPHKDIIDPLLEEYVAQIGIKKKTKEELSAAV